MLRFASHYHHLFTYILVVPISIFATHPNTSYNNIHRKEEDISIRESISKGFANGKYLRGPYGYYNPYSYHSNINDHSPFVKTKGKSRDIRQWIQNVHENYQTRVHVKSPIKRQDLDQDIFDEIGKFFQDSFQDAVSLKNDRLVSIKQELQGYGNTRNFILR